MDDPLAEIATAIDRCAAAPSPDDQAAAFKHYFVPDSTFSHPLCYVGRSADSRSIITEIYFFYRSVIPETSFEVVAKAWDPEALHLFVRLIQRPKFLIVGRFWVPELPMLIHFTLVRREDDGKFLIRDLEDLIQPRSALLCFPVLCWFGVAFYYLCQMMGRLSGRFYRSIGIWRPTKTHSS